MAFRKLLFHSSAVHLRRKAVAFEKSCVYGVVSLFLMRWKNLFYLLAKCYKFLHCQEIPWCTLLIAMDRQNTWPNRTAELLLYSYTETNKCTNF